MRATAGKRVAAGIAALVAVLGCATPAAGDSGAGRFPAVGEFHLRASNGYRIGVYLDGRMATVYAMSGRVGAEYTVRGKRSGNRLEARFGRLGRLALEFHPANRRESCKFTQRGTYRGEIEFSGEDGYTEIHASRAKGLAFTLSPADCGASSSAAARPATIVTHLYAVAKRPNGSASVSVLRWSDRGRAYLVAARRERRAPMSIVRYAFALIGGRGAFVSSGPGTDPGFAFLRPPKPFAGSAVFEGTGAAASSWRGDLSAWLPGAGRVPLAGPSFSSNLCRRRAGETGCGIEPTVTRPLTTLQGSGSQSQLLADARLSWSR